jgi:hypothetical protein
MSRHAIFTAAINFLVVNRKPRATLASVLSLLALSVSVKSGIAQEASPAASSELTFHSSSNLVLIDVIARNATNGLPDKSLQRDDFQIFDNGHPVPIKIFDTGARTRPLALWLVVQCNMQDWQKEGSGLFAGQTSLFKPALKYIDQQDMVAIAHWCDDGDSRLDLHPTADVDALLPALEQVLASVSSPDNHSRSGELALQKTLQLVVDATRSSVPQPLPVIIFLYGDYSAMPRAEADHFIDELLETSAIAFGLNDNRSPHIWWLPGEQREIAHYIAIQTGGEYLQVKPDTYAKGLEKILTQLHFRYELGFKPETLDGKRHKLRIELTDAAKRQHKRVRLRYRSAYVPTANGSK